jgi:cold shock CspA family protein
MLPIAQTRISDEPATLTGRVKCFSRRLQYGIIRSDTGAEIFFPERAIDLDSDLPERRDRVTFQIGRDYTDKPIANCVKVLR